MKQLLWGEFIPWWVLYPPVVLYGIYLSIKYRSLTLPTIANPGIFTGGALGESKFELSRDLYRLSPDLAAKTGLVEGASLQERLDSLQANLQTLQLEYPIVLKPDVGQGGVAVQIAASDEQAIEYLGRHAAKTLVQEYVRGPFEAGVYYCRFPNQKHGSILDITDKQFPFITGDGVSSIKDLILLNPRARMFASEYLAQLGPRSQTVLECKENATICSRGNWVQGCIFRNGERLLSPALEEAIDGISRDMKGFFIGRFDLRYEHEEDLLLGRAFKIVELNGITAIPTSLKDPNTNVWRAWGLLCHVLRCLYEIGDKNREAGHQPMSVGNLVRAFTSFKKAMDLMGYNSEQNSN